MPLEQIVGDILLDGAAALKQHFGKPALLFRRYPESYVKELPQVFVVASAQRIVPKRANELLRTP